MAELAIEVALATAEVQVLLALNVPAGTTAAQALVLSGLAQRFPALEVAQAPLGVFGKLLKAPAEYVMEAGDRLEVYRPLLADPMEVRRARAARAKAAAKKR